MSCYAERMRDSMALFSILLLVVACFIIVRLLGRIFDQDSDTSWTGRWREWEEREQRQVGAKGEQEAWRLVQSVLRPNDHLLRNVAISYDDRRTELDLVVVNENGVFIIEVKNYKGTLLGKEDDFEWEKISQSRGGNFYSKQVKNPIRQVKRQIYLLAHYLQSYGERVWVEGYVILLHNQSPVRSEKVLHHTVELDRRLHTAGREKLSRKRVEAICDLLS